MDGEKVFANKFQLTDNASIACLAILETGITTINPALHLVRSVPADVEHM